MEQGERTRSLRTVQTRSQACIIPNTALIVPWDWLHSQME